MFMGPRYKDRNPPWIKLYNSLLDDHAFAALADRDKGALILIWLLASRLKNRIPCDPAWIRDRIGWKRTPNLTSFIGKGFLIVCESDGPTVDAQQVTDGIASTTLAPCKQDASPETETETEPPPTPQRGKPSVCKKRKPRVGVSPSFDAFWTAYPRKVAKDKARKAFRKINPNAELLAEMLRAVDAQKKAKDWLKEGGQFIPHPVTWLNGRRWEDELEPSNTSGGGDHASSKFAEVPSF